jgi:hypothetical protein
LTARRMVIRAKPLGSPSFEKKRTGVWQIADDTLRKTTMVLRANMLEILLQLEPLDDSYRFAGPFLSRPQRSLKLFGMIRVWSDRGLGIVYGAALGGWAFLITDSILRLSVASSMLSPLKVVIPVVIAFAFIWQVEAWDKETEKPEVMPPKIQKLIEVDRSKERGISSPRRSRKE